MSRLNIVLLSVFAGSATNTASLAINVDWTNSHPMLVSIIAVLVFAPVITYMDYKSSLAARRK